MKKREKLPLLQKKKKIVIVGGGMSGTRLILELIKNNYFEIELVTKNDFEFIPSFPFIFSNNSHLQKIQNTHKNVNINIYKKIFKGIYFLIKKR
jgi:NADH dehydrogenase FAD-containing subunit